jgi:hypothetical protein
LRSDYTLTSDASPVGNRGVRPKFETFFYSIWYASERCDKESCGTHHVRYAVCAIGPIRRYASPLWNDDSEGFLLRVSTNFLMERFNWIGNPNAWVSLVTLTFSKVFSGLTMSFSFRFLLENCPAPNKGTPRTIGLASALITRILLLLSIKWLMELTKPLETIFAHTFSGRDCPFCRGLFLIAKSTHEIHVKFEAAWRRSDCRGSRRSSGDAGSDRAPRHRF